MQIFDDFCTIGLIAHFTKYFALFTFTRNYLLAERACGPTGGPGGPTGGPGG